jgi:hypothetical protein
VLGEVREDGADGAGFFDGCDDPHFAAAVVAGFHVDTEHTLEALCPGHGATFDDSDWPYHHSPLCRLCRDARA